MKQLLLLVSLSLFTHTLLSQGLAVNTTGTAADGSAMLDVSATNRGALFPRMSLAQRVAIATPATGLLVYQTDALTGFYYNAGTPAVPNWIRLSAENYWSLNGSNNIFNNNAGGFVGIGTNAPNSPLQFANDIRNRKITLWESANNDHQFYGFGINGFTLRYQVPDINDNHIFYSGSSSAASNELVRIQGNGNVGIGTSTANAPLQFANSIVNRKIVLFDNNNNDHQYYGFGINGGTLRYQTDATGADHVFFSAASATSSTELMRIRGNGNVGIGTPTLPTYRLDVNGRMRIRSIDATTNSAGIWLNASTNTERAFVGMENDNSVGLFGNNGAGWAFVMNTQTGKVRYQDGTQANGRVLMSDAAGVASWTQLNSTQSVRTGSFGVGVDFNYSDMGFFPGGGTARYTTANITLPPGRWVIIANLLINGTALPAGGGIFMRTYFTESAVSSIGSPDVVAGTGGLISGNFSYSYTFGFVSGQVLINNTSGANKTYFLWATGSRNAAAPSSATIAVGALGSSAWSENQLIAIPMN